MKSSSRFAVALLFLSSLALSSASAQELIQAIQLLRLETVSAGVSVRFYTTDQAEIRRLTTNGVWKLEGVAGWLFPRQVVGTMPLYRLALNKNSHPAHFYTVNRDEANKAWTDGYTYEGVAGYVAITQMPGTTPFLRLSNTVIGHFYTTNADEASIAVKSFGYSDEGHEGYVWTGPASLAAAPAGKVIYRRIGGAKYFNIDEVNTADRFTVNAGFMCVIHDPGCPGVGNKGEDRFFSGLKHLPIGADLASYVYIPLWPKGTKLQNPGGIGGIGSYGQRITSGSVPLTIGWDNTCALGAYYNKPTYYTITFVIATQEGVELGEDAFEPSGIRYGPLPLNTGPPCAPPDYSSVDTSTNEPHGRTLAAFTDYLRLQTGQVNVTYADTFPAAGLGGDPGQWDVLTFTNINAFPIFLLRAGMSPQQCFESGAGVRVEPAGFTAAPALYGVTTLHAPITVVACIFNMASVPGVISLNISYSH